MKTVEIVESFTGYPGKHEQQFTAGKTVEVSDAFADLIVGKGHARLPTKAAAAAKKDDEQ